MHFCEGYITTDGNTKPTRSCMNSLCKPEVFVELHK